MNPYIVLVCGQSGGGKSASLRNLPEPSNVLFLNAESNKALPFRNGSKFWSINIDDPVEVLDVFDMLAEEDGDAADIHTVALDSVTMLMDKYETMHVVDSANTQKAWGDYHQYFLKIFNERAPRINKRFVVTAHVDTFLNEAKGIEETKVKVKGALQSRGVEAYFNTVIYAKCMPIKKLEKYKNDLLNITDQERALGYKYVFQTNKDKSTTGESIKTSMGMFSEQETFIDNDIELVFQRIADFQPE